MCTTAIGKNKVNDNTHKRKHEDNQSPKKFQGNIAVAFENFHKDKDVKEQNQETNNPSGKSPYVVHVCIVLYCGEDVKNFELV